MIGIVYIGNLKYCPYLNKYTYILDLANQRYEVLFWDREGCAQIYPDNYIHFKLRSRLDKKPIYKLYDFLKYGKWINYMVNKRKYSKLILLSTLSGVVLNRTIKKEFKGKYIFDIRDYSYEKNKLFLGLIDRLVSDSYFTCISSEMFKKFLPENYPYVIAHNFNKNELVYRNKLSKKKLGETLYIVWVGSIRYFEHQVKIIDKIKDDKRFKLIYHGSGPELDKYINYCSRHNITGVSFTGEYSNQDKHELYNNADILNNSYNTRKVMEVKYAISNKYYDGLIYGIMQLVETNTYKHRLVEEKGLGVGLEPEDEDFADKLYNYYHGLNEVEFNSNCDNILESIIIEDLQYTERIITFFHSEITPKRVIVQL